MKAKRQAAIREIVEHQSIQTQEELAEALRAQGMIVTQATVSRDIKEMHLFKVLAEDGSYRYATMDRENQTTNDRLIRMLSDSVLDMAGANNLVVIHTLPGSAHVAAEAIDTLKWQEVLGTIAGDNTILMILRSNEEVEPVIRRFKGIIDKREDAMLLQLSIHHLALIDEMTIDFAPGMNVLTGETGAGKSIVVDAVNLVLGERATKELISAGEMKARVEAVFDIAENEQAKALLSEMELGTEDDTASISRELTSAGKNICRINGTVVPLAKLRQISAQLLDIHGQHEHQLLLDSRNHVGYLDGYAADEIRPLLEKTQQLYSVWRGAKTKLERMRKSVAEREQRIDMLRFQFDELRGARLVLDEEIELERQKVFYRNAGKIISAFDEAVSLLSGGGVSDSGAVDMLRESVEALSPVAALDEKYEAVYARLDGLYYELEDAARDLSSLHEEMEFDEEDAERVEARLDLLRRLSRKYGASTKDMIRYRDTIAAQLEEMEDSDEAMERLEKELRQSAKALKAVSEELTRVRMEAAKRFEKSIETQLRDLGMKNVRLAMDFAPLGEGERITDRFSAQGVDQIEMMFCANLGQPMRPLAKVASGGELSRIMLALKNLLAQKPGIPRSMVFDEIDTGISGRTAQVVSEKMSQIGDHHQVICVTHLPQIAAMADEQFLVRKHDVDGVTRTAVLRLNEEQRAQELARMVGGADCESETSIRHAYTMIEDAKSRKQELRAAFSEIK